MNFEHPLAQNKEQWEGYTVFTFEFNGVPIKFVTLKDAQYVLQKSKGVVGGTQR